MLYEKEAITIKKQIQRLITKWYLSSCCALLLTSCGTSSDPCDNWIQKSAFITDCATVQVNRSTFTMTYERDSIDETGIIRFYKNQEYYKEVTFIPRNINNFDFLGIVAESEELYFNYSYGTYSSIVQMFIYFKTDGDNLLLDRSHSYIYDRNDESERQEILTYKREISKEALNDLFWE